MKILITNDDGVNAPQLLPLIRWCQELGEVTTVVPKFQQSGKSHSIELYNGFEVKQVDLAPDISVYTVDSTPADCIRYAVLGLKQTFDLVISGVNKGFNMGRDILYSGTVGAVFEAATYGMNAVAISTSAAFYDRAIEPLDTVWEFIQTHKLLSHNTHYNINIIPDAKGIRITRMGGHYFSDDFVSQGNDIYQPKGKCVYQDNGDMSLDTNCVVHGYISIMPLTNNRVNTDAYDQLKHLSSE